MRARALAAALLAVSALGARADGETAAPSPDAKAPAASGEAKSGAEEKGAGGGAAAKGEARAQSEAPRGWELLVDARKLDEGELQIEMTLRGTPALSRLCADMRGAGRGVHGLHAVFADREGAPFAQDKDHPDCFDGKAPASAFRYRLSLGELARGRGDPDWAARVGEGFIFNEEAVLLRPDPLPEGATLRVEFLLPEGVSVAAPWRALDGSGRRFESDSRQYDAGSYVAIGKMERLAPITSSQWPGQFELVLMAGAHRCSRAALEAWVGKAARAVGDFYRGVPTGRALAILVPAPGESDAGVFGTTLHRATPSAVLFFGAEATDAALATDWMATHELFHTGNPRLSSRVHWFNEGSATYYQDVLRARAGMEPPEVIWSDLYDGFRRFCGMRHGESLAEESGQLRERHHFTDVYWGGACLFFRADVMIRERTNNARSLDDLMRELLARSQDELLDEDDLLDALDEAVGSDALRRMLRAKQPDIPKSEYNKLGIVPVADDKVTLRDDAPEAAIRRSILEERAAARAK